MMQNLSRNVCELDLLAFYRNNNDTRLEMYYAKFVLNWDSYRNNTSSEIEASDVWKQCTTSS